MSAMSADGNDSELLHRKRKVPDTPIQSWWGAVYGPGVEGCGHSGFPEDEDSPWEVVDHHDEDDPIESHGLSVADFCLQVKVIFFVSNGEIGEYFCPCRQPSTAREIS